LEIVTFWSISFEFISETVRDIENMSAYYWKLLTQ